ncbi:pentapeptide repeat-containing protein [Pseudoclavibacter terrae]|uniref:pentapeptide repeat-containing protein n=1 Tax=Pseudoclavibacter terrae TaxID=1530195 RepID=UPI00232D9EEA|nr:pentapeptide repeat-containing protein [Pseudoclavibacter terrae]
MAAARGRRGSRTGGTEARIEAPFLPELDEARAVDFATARVHELQHFVDVQGEEIDAAGVTFSECRIEGLTARRLLLHSGRVSECVLERVEVPVVEGQRQSFRSVSWTASRLGSADLHESDLQNVEFRDNRLGYVNLRGSTLTDVQFADCAFDEIDLGGATAKRVAFTESRTGILDVTGARLEHVDLRGLEFSTITGLEGLRGVTVTPSQLEALAPHLAAHLGIEVRDAGR